MFFGLKKMSGFSDCIAVIEHRQRGDRSCHRLLRGGSIWQIVPHRQVIGPVFKKVHIRCIFLYTRV